MLTFFPCFDFPEFGKVFPHRRDDKNILGDHFPQKFRKDLDTALQPLVLVDQEHGPALDNTIAAAGFDPGGPEILLGYFNAQAFAQVFQFLVQSIRIHVGIRN